MAEAETPPSAEVVVAEAPAATAASEDKKPVVEEEKAEAKPVQSEPEQKKAEGETVLPSASFKEESNIVADLVDPEKKALDELKQLVRAALDKNEFDPPPPPSAAPSAPEEEKALAKEGEEEKPAEESAPVAEDEPPKPSEPAPAAAAEEPLKAEVLVEPAPPAKEEPLPLPPPAVEDKAVTAEDDGSKTVEAIEETVVPVAALPSAAEEVPPVAVEDAIKEPIADIPAPPPEEVFIWGVPLLGDEKSNTVLLKFLRARDFKVKEAFAMLKNAVIWRKQFGIEALLEEDLGLPELEKVVYTHGVDKEGHPVCYNVYGEFQNKELYDKIFGEAEKRQKFLKWRIQYLEKGIREHLDFAPGGISSMVQVTDLKNSPRIGKHRQVTRQAVTLLQDNYPEFIAKKVFINVPWWYLAVNRMMSPFFTQRTKSKFVFAGPSKSAETLFKYVAPEQVPVAFGGLCKHEDSDFTTADAVTEVSLKPASKEAIEIPATEACSLVWELRVLGWEVSYGAEFTPNAEDGYTVIVQKARKLVANGEPVVKGSFKVGEPGRVVLNIENPTSKKKKILYRWKVNSSAEST